MNRTPICWVKNPNGTQGYTWNPITGCINHTKGMCNGGGFPCYAYRLANTRLRERYLANTNVTTADINIATHPLDVVRRANGPFYPRFWEDRLYHAWGGEPKGIFVCDMSDMFGKGIPEEWTAKVLNLCKLHSENRYYLLTKQPQNLAKFSPFPPNCWVGVTATGPKMFVDALASLKQIEAKVKYISVEPYLERINPHWLDVYLKDAGIRWVILGSQTKPTVSPKTEHVQEIVEACDKAGVPVFLKENLRSLLQQNDHNIYSFPEWAGKQFAVTGDRTLAPSNPHPNEPMRLLKQEVPK